MENSAGRFSDERTGEEEAPPRSKVNRQGSDPREKTAVTKSRKASVPIKKIVGLLIVFLFLAAIYVGPFLDMLYGPLGIGRVYPEKADFTINRTIRLQNVRKDSLDYNLTLAEPYDISKHELQTVNEIDWNLEPKTYYKNGTAWDSWDRKLEGGEADTIRISYDVSTRTYDWDYSSSDSGKVSDISDELKSRYNRNQWQLERDRDGDGENDWMIEPGDPQIQELAQKITKGKENIYEKSKAIYEWVHENISYQLGGSLLPQHSSAVLESREGDCDEQSFLYISLLRAVGISAWMELGVLYDRGGQRWGGHGWVRMSFVDQEGNKDWVNVDPVNDQFFFRDALRFTTWIDNGVKGQLEDYYYYISWYGDKDDLEIDDDFEEVKMKTEGSVRPNSKQKTPGFELSMAIPVLTSSAVLYYWKKRKKRS